MGSNNPILYRSNKKICKYFFKIKNIKYNDRDFKNHIEFVVDRPGHDKKYLINSSKIRKRLKLETNL